MHVDLEARLKRLMLFRVVMVTTLLFIATYVEAVSETLLRVNPLYFVIVATYALTVGHAIALRFVSSRSVLAYAQVRGRSSGHHRPRPRHRGRADRLPAALPARRFSPSTVLVPRREALSIAGVATLLYGGLLAAVRLDIVSPQGLSDVLYPAGARRSSTPPSSSGWPARRWRCWGPTSPRASQHAGRQLEQAEVEVADLRELNQVIVDSIQSGLIMTDAEGRVRHVNAFGEGILGRRAPSAAGRCRCARCWARPFSGAPSCGPGPRAGPSPGSRSAIAIPDGAELELGVSGHARSRPRRRPGAAISWSSRTSPTSAVSRPEVRTNEKLAAVGEMAAQLAHEIRNPLGSIRGSAQVLAGEPGFSDEQGRLLTIISRESKRLSDTLNRFLFQARSTGRPRDVVDLRPLLEEAVTLLRNGPEIGLDHAVKLEVDDGPHLCLADPDQITQVFWNLARNALEAMPGGGDLDVRLRRVGAEVVFTVRDQGRGMAREEQRRVFEPFQSSSPMGTGLGLAIVYRIVREHGGDIRVRSAPAEGTEVEVRLPHADVAESVRAGA